MNQEFFEDAVDFNARTAQAIYEEFNLRQDMGELTENIHILVWKHMKDMRKKNKALKRSPIKSPKKKKIRTKKKSKKIIKKNGIR